MVALASTPTFHVRGRAAAVHNAGFHAMIGRRDLIRHAAAIVALTAAPLMAKGDERPLASLLLPLTGPSADLARSLRHAAELAMPPGMAPLSVFDTGPTPAGAGLAAAAAVRRGAPLLIGPLFSAQVAPVAAAARDTPVIALSNDASDGTGAFILGITSRQSVGAILGYARARGVRRIALAPGTTPWERLASEAARSSARDLGLTLVDPPMADAILVTGDADALVATSGSSRAGTQLLATHQAMGLSGGGRAVVEGAWLAAPDPDGFAGFGRRFETAYGNPPGVLAGLAYDAIGIARTLRTSGHVSRDGLTGSAGFAGVCGAVRFDADGSAARELAIVVVEGGAFHIVAHGHPA